MTDRSKGGWGAPPPPGTTPCVCATRRLWWARLENRRFGGCCQRACCRGRLTAVMVTAQELAALRDRCLAERWHCPRCGETVFLHQAMFECLDRGTKAIRAARERRAWARR